YQDFFDMKTLTENIYVDFNGLIRSGRTPNHNTNIYINKINSFGTDKLLDIFKNYHNRLKEIADWLYFGFALNQETYLAKNLFWASNKLEDDIFQYYNWDESLDKEKAGKHIGGVLRNLVNKYIIKGAKNEGDWVRWKIDYELYWKTKLKSGSFFSQSKAY